jgi:hypothetical protein
LFSYIPKTRTSKDYSVVTSYVPKPKRGSSTHFEKTGIKSSKTHPRKLEERRTQSGEVSLEICFGSRTK